MSERWDKRNEDWRDFPEWQKELKDDSDEESQGLHAERNEQEDESSPDDDRRGLRQRRVNPDTDDLE